ncbi:MAG: 2'-5' RNA ligase family protein [Clostridia bacterium]|nr:2'-5' RNA ligase family protein [Clostridia bacterium]
MKQEKFLTVYAVLDETTQSELTQLQSRILKKYPQGTQTMGIPFHISLGSFPVSEREDLVRRIEDCIKESSSFPIKLRTLGHFNYSVIFVEPEINDRLVELHKHFEGNFADGFSWHPHVTLYCGKEEDGIKILNEFSFEKKTAQIVAIELGEFFPTKIIMNGKLARNTTLL